MSKTPDCVVVGYLEVIASSVPADANLGGVGWWFEGRNTVVSLCELHSENPSLKFPKPV